MRNSVHTLFPSNTEYRRKSSGSFRGIWTACT